MQTISNFLHRNRAPEFAPLPAGISAEEDKVVSREVITRVMDALDGAKGDRSRKMLMLPRHWRAINTAFTLDYEVRNGGFHQFFTNTGGAFDEILIEDISSLGHTEYLRRVKDAFEEYQKHDYTGQWANRGKSWDYFSKPNREGRFRIQDKAYFAVKPRMRSVIAQFVRKNIDSFESR
ncbi:MAG: DUF4375 domain-containing protein [Planctomycetota bacterium]